MKKSKRVFVFISLAVFINLIVIIITALLCNITPLSFERKRAEDFFEKENISIDKLSGMIFEYELQYDFENGEKQQLNGKEIYYWDGSDFIPISEHMKGYDE